MPCIMYHTYLVVHFRTLNRLPVAGVGTLIYRQK